MAKVIIPQYYKNFKCIGDNCEDSCCCGWKITIDRKTYNKYKQIKDSKIKKLLNKSVSRNRSELRDDKNYGKFKLQNNRCPLLDENSLCKIHKELGEQYLCTTCSVYPRNINKIDDVYEISTTFSCPEAARVALLNKKKMEFDYVEKYEKKENWNGIINEIKTDNLTQKWFWDIRKFSIRIIQTGEGGLWKKIVLLGMFLSDIDKVIKLNEFIEISNIINKYEKVLDDKQVYRDFDAIEDRDGIKLTILTTLLNSYLNNDNNNSKYIFDKFIKTFFENEKSDSDELGKIYRQKFEQAKKSYLVEKEYILENYIVNYIFKNMYFNLKEESVYYEYVKLVITFSLIKVLLVGCIDVFSINYDNEIIKVIQVNARYLEHNPMLIHNIYKTLKESNMDRLSYMTIFLKD